MTRILLLLAGILLAQEAKKELPALTAAEFDARRAKLMKAFDGAVVVDSGVLRAGAAGIQGDAGAAIVELRVIKSEAEVRMMRKASDATNKAHVAAMKACKAGMNEGELQKVIESTFKAEDCDELAFPSIVGSGKNGTV